MTRRIRITSLERLEQIYPQVQDNWFRFIDLVNPPFNQSVLSGMGKEKILLRKKDKSGRFSYWKITPLAIGALQESGRI